MKKRLVIFAGLLIPALLKAMVSLCIGIMVLVVGGFVAYELFGVTKTLLPDQPPAQNQIDPMSHYLVKTDAADSAYLYEEFGSLVPYTYFCTLIQPHGHGSPVAGFTIQYGLDVFNAPWVVLALIQPGDQIFNIQTLVNTEDEYSVAITYCDRTVFYTTGVTGDTQMTETNLPQTVVIERSGDLVNWSPVFTNQVYAGHKQTFTDSDAPADRGFYRLKVQ